jgi:transcriptional regulator of acetoin/glycerol metabolism
LEFREAIAPDNNSHLTLLEAQRQHIQKALDTEGGNVARAAARLGVTRATLYNKMKTFAIHTSREKGVAAGS